MWKDSELTKPDHQYATLWKGFADSLGIELISPFVIKYNGTKYKYALCIKNFGNDKAKNGVVCRVEGEVFTPEECGEIWNAAVENGYLPYNQAMGAISFTLEEAKHTLNMYKWYGSESKRPKWHTGELYNELWEE